ncbi:MAG TPA: GNAT family N-acetyltransferase [Actinomycetota bacterium]|nr:GNAT family N-acetyltransferase [Actinomycetota bacterium]
MTEIRFRPLARADFALLAVWLGAEHVTPWFDHTPTAPDEIEAKYGPRVDGTDATRVYVVELEGEPVGFVQWTPASQYGWWPAELGLEQDSVALDGLLGTPVVLGRGLGPRILSQFLAEAPGDFGGATRVIGETALGNQPMWRTMERVGFKCVHEGDLTRDGKTDRRVYVYERQR